MAKARTSKRQTAGRPPSGPDGERVSDYPRLTIRIPHATKDQLESLSILKRCQVWRLVDRAVLDYIKGLSGDDRKALAEFSSRIVPAPKPKSEK